MPVEVGQSAEPAYPVRVDTLKKLERAYNRVMREHVRNGPLDGLDYDEPQILKGKLDGDLSQGGSVTVSLWEPNSGGTEADTGNNITAYDWLLSPGKLLPSAAKVVIVHIGKRWYVVASSECQEDA